MPTNSTSKSAETNRSATSRRAPGNKAASTRDRAANTTARGKCKAPPAQQPVGARITKHAVLLQLLNRAEGTTIPELMEATSWQQHSVRGFLAGTAKKKLGLTLTSSKVDGEPRRYRIAPSRRGR
jgi:hypothetical protein